VQHDVLAAHPTAKLRVYTVWFNVLDGDDRAGWDPRVIPDPRVAQLWDEQALVSGWFRDHVVKQPTEVVWDAYFLYGPDAGWEDAPGPLISANGPVIGVRRQLLADLQPLLVQR
jgi:hypothetical protein